MQHASNPQPKTIKLKDLQPGDGFVGEEERAGQHPRRVPRWETVLRVTQCYAGASTEYISVSGRLYFGRSDSEIEIWR